MAQPTVVLVHGAWHGAWCWERLTPLLDHAGVTWRTLDLPLTALPDDVAATSALLDQVAGPVVLVGHSYGGIVISAAGTHPAVAHLVYLAAFAVTEDEPVSATLPDAAVAVGALADAVRIDDAGLTTLDRDEGIACLYNRCDAADAGRAFDRLRPIALQCLMTAPGSAAWRTTPTTYAVCGDDRAVPPALQRLMAARSGGRIVEWDADHSPFLSRPQLVADLLVELAG